MLSISVFIVTNTHIRFKQVEKGKNDVKKNLIVRSAYSTVKYYWTIYRWTKLNNALEKKPKN